MHLWWCSYNLTPAVAEVPNEFGFVRLSIRPFVPNAKSHDLKA